MRKKKKRKQKKQMDSVKTQQSAAPDNRTKSSMPCPESIKIVYEIAQELMQQEKDRSALIMTKSQNLLKYISSTLGVVNTVLVFMVNQTLIDTSQWIWGMILINIPLMVSLINRSSLY